MARIFKGAKRYLFFRGKDDQGGDIVIDFFSRKELDGAMKAGRVAENDYVIKVDVIGKMDLKPPKKPKRG